MNLPKDMNSPDEDADITKDTSVVISIPDNNNFYVGKDQFPLTGLGEKIQSMMKDKAPDKRIVYIKSGVDVNYGTVVQAIDEEIKKAKSTVAGEPARMERFKKATAVLR